MTELEGKVTGVFLGLNKDSIVTTKQDVVYTDYGGLDNGVASRDRHFGLTRKTGEREPNYPRGTEIFNTRQVSAASEEELQKIAQTLGLKNLPGEWLGLNLTVLGIIGFTYLPPMTKLFFPEDTVISLTGENLPCTGPGEVINQHHPEIPVNAFPKAAIGKRGVTGIIERPGLIKPNDIMKVVLPVQRIYMFPGKK